MPTPTDFGRRLKHARTSADLSRAQLAAEIGITPDAVVKVELGYSKSLAAKHIFQAARAVQVSPEWLVTGNGSRSAA